MVEDSQRFPAGAPGEQEKKQQLLWYGYSFVNLKSQIGVYNRYMYVILTVNITNHYSPDLSI